MAVQHRQVQSIWMISREYGDLAGAGGVRDVVCQLAEALARWTGRSLHVVLPRYGFIDTALQGFLPVADPLCDDRELRLQLDMHHPDQAVLEEVGFFYRKMNRVNIYLVDAERYKQKSDVYVYSETEERRVSWQKKSMGHHDYFAMNLLLQKAALELMIALDVKPDIIHCHDGHTAVLAGLIRENSGYRGYFRGTGCLVTIHNAGLGYHQEVADIPYACSITGLPYQVIEDNQLDQKFDPFLVAGSYAMVNTVSENYAKELQGSDEDRLTGWLGHALKSRGVILEGVTNGIAPADFSSQAVAGEMSELLFDPADAKDLLEGKKNCKRLLLGQLGARSLPQGVEFFGGLDGDVEQPLFTFIGRLNEQKGVDLLLGVIEELMAEDPQPQLLVLGRGDTLLETQLIRLTEDSSLQGRVGFLQGFSPELANRIYAAGDFFIVPSRYEPCGLTDFIAQLFGNIPVVHHVGGLVKVVDNVTGLAYMDGFPDDLFGALRRALDLYQDKQRLRRIQLQAVQEIEHRYTWEKVKYKYLELYRQARKSQLCQ
ncbi:MAG: glycogen synthase [Desulforhopalus sp.]